MVNLMMAMVIIIAFSVLPLRQIIVSSQKMQGNWRVTEAAHRVYDYYAEVINYRHLFIPLVEETQIFLPQIETKPEPVIVIAPPLLPIPQPLPELTRPPDISRISLSERASTLSLVGIIEDTGGRLAVIQDKRLGKEYLLKQGDLIQGIIIEKVCEEKVILWYEEEQLELRM